MQKLINHDTKWPYISFRPIIVIYQAFRTHINGAANGYVGKERFSPDWKPKVSDLVIVIGKENIGDFEISVDDKILVEIL